jgi:DNA-binding transcriptional ArsR family regulator
VTTATTSQPGVPELARRLAPVLKALADENRLAVLLALSQRPLSVRDLAEAVELPQTLVSHHLRALRETGLVSLTPRGRSNVYSLCCGVLIEPIRLLSTLAGVAGATEDPESSR